MVAQYAVYAQARCAKLALPARAQGGRMRALGGTHAMAFLAWARAESGAPLRGAPLF